MKPNSPPRNQCARVMFPPRRRFHAEHCIEVWREWDGRVVSIVANLSVVTVGTLESNPRKNQDRLVVGGTIRMERELNNSPVTATSRRPDPTVFFDFRSLRCRAGTRCLTSAEGLRRGFVGIRANRAGGETRARPSIGRSHPRCRHSIKRGRSGCRFTSLARTETPLRPTRRRPRMARRRCPTGSTPNLWSRWSCPPNEDGSHPYSHSSNVFRVSGIPAKVGVTEWSL